MCFMETATRFWVRPRTLRIRGPFTCSTGHVAREMKEKKQRKKKVKKKMMIIVMHGDDEVAADDQNG